MKLGGVFTVLQTPLTDNDQIDEEIFERELVRFNGVDYRINGDRTSEFNAELSVGNMFIPVSMVPPASTLPTSSPTKKLQVLAPSSRPHSLVTTTLVSLSPAPPLIMVDKIRTSSFVVPQALWPAPYSYQIIHPTDLWQG